MDSFYTEAEDAATLLALEQFNENLLSPVFLETAGSWLPLISPKSMYHLNSVPSACEDGKPIWTAPECCSSSWATELRDAAFAARRCVRGQQHEEQQQQQWLELHEPPIQDMAKQHRHVGYEQQHEQPSLFAAVQLPQLTHQHSFLYNDDSTAFHAPSSCALAVGSSSGDASPVDIYIHQILDQTRWLEGPSRHERTYDSGPGWQHATPSDTDCFTSPACSVAWHGSEFCSATLLPGCNTCTPCPPTNDWHLTHSMGTQAYPIHPASSIHPPMMSVQPQQLQQQHLQQLQHQLMWQQQQQLQQQQQQHQLSVQRRQQLQSQLEEQQQQQEQQQQHAFNRSAPLVHTHLAGPLITSILTQNVAAKSLRKPKLANANSDKPVERDQGQAAPSARQPPPQTDAADLWVASLSRRKVEQQLRRLSVVLVEKTVELKALKRDNESLQGRERVLHFVADVRKEQMERLLRPASVELLADTVALLLKILNRPSPHKEMEAVKEHGWNIDATSWLDMFTLLVEVLSTLLLSEGEDSPAERIYNVMDALKLVYQEIFVRCASSFFKMCTLSVEGAPSPPPEDALWLLQCEAINLSPQQIEDVCHLHDLYCAWSGAVLQQRRQLCDQLAATFTDAPSGSKGSMVDAAEVVELLHKNVVQERCLLSLVDEVLCYRCLNPVQIAMMLVISYPYPGDCPTCLHAIASYHAGHRYPAKVSGAAEQSAERAATAAAVKACREQLELCAL